VGHAIIGYKQEASYLSMMKGINGWQSILRNSNCVLAQVVTLPEEVSMSFVVTPIIKITLVT
jgi:hypothetical protein